MMAKRPPLSKQWRVLPQTICPLSVLSSLQNGFPFHPNNHLSLEKKFLFKWISKLKVDVNIILFNKNFSAEVKARPWALGVPAGHMSFGGPPVWVTPAVNSDQPEGPEENKRLQKKMNILFIWLFLFPPPFF